MEASPAPEPQVRPLKWLRWLAPAIFLVALWLRLIGIGWGLPNEIRNQSLHPDEQVIFSYALQIEPTKLDFTPGFYNYGTLYLTTLRIASDVVAGYTGGPKADDPASVWDYMKRCHLAGRIVSAVAGALTALFVFLTLRRFVGSLGASLGALLIAFAPSHTVHSRFQTVDVLAVCLLAISLWFAVRILDDPNPAKCTVWAGIFAGLSAGTKYTGVLALLAILVAVALRKEQPGRLSGLAVLCTLLAFVAATPGALLETDRFLKDVRYEMLHTSTGHGLVFEGVGSGFFYHLTNLIHGAGPAGLLLGLAGMGFALAAKSRPMAVLLAFSLPYYILIGRADVHFVRYSLPLLIVVAAGFGYAADYGHKERGWRIGFPIAALISLGMVLMVTVGFALRMDSIDDRDAYARQFKAREDADTITVGIPNDPWFYSLPLIPDSAIMRGQMELQRQEMEAARPRVVQYFPPRLEDRVNWDIRLIDELAPDYIVFSNLEVGPVARLAEQGHPSPEVARFKAFQTRLLKKYEPLFSMPSGAGADRPTRMYEGSQMVEDLAYVRPVIYLWKRRP